MFKAPRIYVLIVVRRFISTHNLFLSTKFRLEVRRFVSILNTCFDES